MYKHTMPVVFKVEELVAPLCHDPDGILEERYDDQETPNGW